MTSKSIPPFGVATLEAVAVTLGETNSGLTNTEIASVLGAIRLKDPLAEVKATARAANPLVAQGFAWPKMSKRERIAKAILSNQERNETGSALVGFISEAMKPARHHNNPARHVRYRDALNQVLVLEGLRVNEEGRVARGPKASTLSDAAQLAGTLSTELRRREAHDLVLAYCTEEILGKDLFHAVQGDVRAASGNDGFEP